MAAVLTNHTPIIPVSTVSGNAEAIWNYLEGASQTFVQGAPVKLSAGAVIVAASAFANTAPIVGFSTLPGHNLASAGKGASPLFGSIGFPGGAPTFGTVPNQPSAVNIPHGAEYVDGLMGVYQAVQDTIFEGQVDNSTGAGTLAATTTMIGEFASLVTDTNNNWYIDLNTLSTTQGTLVVLIVGLNPLDLASGSVTTQSNFGRVRFKVVPDASAVSGA